MTFKAKTLFSMPLAIVALAACGGSGGSGGGGDVTQEPYFFGAIDDSSSANGLPFAAEGALSSNSANNITVPLVTADIAATQIPANVRASTTQFSAGISFFLGGSDNFDVDVDGETVTVAGGTGVLSDGRTIEAIRLTPSVGGNIVGFAIADGGVYESISAFGFRNETPPSIIAGRSGTANFDGLLQMLSAAYVDGDLVDIGTQLQGPMTLSVDFSDGTVSGDIPAIPLGVGASTLSGSLSGDTIFGNAALGDIAWTCGNGATCSDTAAFGLVFGRADRLAIGGLTSIDADITFDDESEATIVGVGGFSLLED